MCPREEQRWASVLPVMEESHRLYSPLSWCSLTFVVAFSNPHLGLLRVRLTRAGIAGNRPLVSSANSCHSPPNHRCCIIKQKSTFHTPHTAASSIRALHNGTQDAVTAAKKTEGLRLLFGFISSVSTPRNHSRPSNSGLNVSWVFILT